MTANRNRRGAKLLEVPIIEAVVLVVAGLTNVVAQQVMHSYGLLYIISVALFFSLIPAILLSPFSRRISTWGIEICVAIGALCLPIPYILSQFEPDLALPFSLLEPLGAGLLIFSALAWLRQREERPDTAAH